MKSQVWNHLLIGSSVLLSPSTNAFIPTRQLSSSFIVRQSNNPKIQLQTSVEAEDVISDTPNSLKPAPKDVFPTAQFYTFDMPEHRPLGCTVEESLDPLEEYVFVSKVAPGGFADQAGIRVGDVLVAVTGLFGDVKTIVLESGVDKIKGLVSSVREEDPLTLQIARGTGVLDRHESAIVDLCQSPGADDKDVENCMVDFLAAGYADYGGDVEDAEVLCDDGDTECLIDGMMNMWNEDLPPPPTMSEIADQPAEESAKKVKPWSSRSSPSGTYVRDPATGVMGNIDETDWGNTK